MTVVLVAISTYNMILRFVALVAINHFVVCAFKVKEDPFVHSIVLSDLFFVVFFSAA